MQFSTDIRSEDFGAKLDAFNRLVPSNHWHRNLVKIKNEIRGNAFLKEYLFDRNKILFSLERLITRSNSLDSVVMSGSQNPGALYETTVLVSLFVDIYHILPAPHNERLLRRLIGSFKNPDDLRGLLFELQVATHLVKNGFDIEFAIDYEKSNGIFDIAARKSGVTVEVECKSISNDKGRKIHRREALEWNNLIWREFAKIAPRMTSAIAIRIRFSGRPTKNYNERLEVVKAVKLAFLTNRKIDTDKFTIDIVEFDIKHTRVLGNPTASKLEHDAVLVEVLGSANHELLIRVSVDKYALIISLESQEKNTVVDSIFQTISSAAENQLTGNGPSLIIVKLEDLTADQLKELGNESENPTALRIASSNFMDSKKASNVSMLAFLADGPVSRLDDGAITRTGATYSFANERNIFSETVKNLNLFNNGSEGR